jgi:hypothetical protein
VPIVLKSVSLSLLEPSGSVQAYNRIALPFFFGGGGGLLNTKNLSDSFALPFWNYTPVSVFSPLQHHTLNIQDDLSTFTYKIKLYLSNVICLVVQSFVQRISLRFPV